MSEDQEKIVRKLSENREMLHIKRIPLNTKREFMRFAEEEFCDDWGMALKWLWDFYKGSIPNNNEQINQKLRELEDKVNALYEVIITAEQKPEKPQKKKMLGGNEINLKRGEEDG